VRNVATLSSKWGSATDTSFKNINIKPCRI
jgi:hypothetical protein